MPSRTRRILAVALALATLLVTAACGDDATDEDATGAVAEPTTEPADEPEALAEPEPVVEPVADAPADLDSGETLIGYELLERMDDGTIRAWVSTDAITQEEFEAIELPANWSKNQPRESSIDRGTFNGSPGAGGATVYEAHFGHQWFHAATVVQVGVPVDEEGLLAGAIVNKDHEIGFEPGGVVVALVSPEDETYVRIGRDAGRASDDPSLPTGWQIVEIEVPDGYTSLLPDGTLVIRTDNQDSFQGPVTGLDIGSGIAVTGSSTGVVTTGFGAESTDANTDEVTAFLSIRPEEDDAFYMVNLISYRDVADYPDGRDSDLTGREADAIYGEFMATTMLPEIGAEIVYNALVPATEGFDTVAIVRYPSRSAFLSMNSNPQFQEMSMHKQAGVAETVVLATELISLGDVTSGEMVLHLIGPDQIGTTVPGERAVFQVNATIIGQATTFSEVRIGTGGVESAVLSVSHQPLGDLLSQSE
jgi:hypothetical protein